MRLHRFPVHTIKIDQSFIKEIRSEHGHYPVILAIISIARGLGMKLVAEGVETEAQARYLKQAGCGVLQGFLFHKAISQTEFLRLLRQNYRVNIPLTTPVPLHSSVSVNRRHGI